jgi:2-polyprenyl-6-methoxyphenol hydroxylase-like FAD-dependent oxidoreductase
MIADVIIAGAGISVLACGLAVPRNGLKRLIFDAAE